MKSMNIDEFLNALIPLQTSLLITSRPRVQNLGSYEKGPNCKGHLYETKGNIENHVRAKCRP